MDFTMMRSPYLVTVSIMFINYYLLLRIRKKVTSVCIYSLNARFTCVLDILFRYDGLPVDEQMGNAFYNI